MRRPIHWDRLRGDEAERIVRERAADTANFIIGDHALDRVEERSITTVDVYRILRTGRVKGDPEKTADGDWKVVVVMLFPRAAMPVW